MRVAHSPCKCKYQQEKCWGYEVFVWRGKKWKPVGVSPGVAGAECQERRGWILPPKRDAQRCAKEQAIGLLDH